MNPKIKVVAPKKCHLWEKKSITRDELINSFNVIKTYEEDSHLTRNLLKCKECGHLYFHEFYEEINWKNGNDPQYSTWIPVADEKSADKLSKLSQIMLNAYLSIRHDFPSNAKKPTGPYWCGKNK